MKNYVFNAVDNSKVKGDKPISFMLPIKKKKPKVIKIKTPHYTFRNKRKLWNIPENF